jgi:hypothetical protein
MLDELIHRHAGVLKLKPTYVRRFYRDFNRLEQHRLRRGARDLIPERWIASSVEAVNPPPLPRGGLSMLEGTARPVSLRDAIKRHPVEIIGEAAFRRRGAEFPVLVKLLDPGEPIINHFHASDAQVKRFAKNFVGHRFGKDEAYYFPEAPKGPMPYTHVGLHPGVTRRELTDAVRRGPEHALELSPSFYQEFETGFFVPAAIPHRPGTALTLEVQQPSDVYTYLETHVGGRPLSPRQIHPGFPTLDEAFGLIDLKLAEAVGRLDSNRLAPRPTRVRGGEVATIFPVEVCRKFSGKRLRVTASMTYREPSAIALLIWRGRGTINGRRVRGGDEFFVVFSAARMGIEITNDGGETLELFSFMPAI